MEVLGLPSVGRAVAVRLDTGEDVFEALGQVAQEEDIRAGFVSTALGALNDAVVGFFDGETYHKKTFAGSHELLQLSGSIARLQDKPHLHLHVVLGDPEHRAMGGHLHSAKVGFLAEILLIALPAQFGRTPRGRELKVLSLRPPS